MTAVDKIWVEFHLMRKESREERDGWALIIAVNYSGIVFAATHVFYPTLARRFFSTIPITHHEASVRWVPIVK